MKWEWRNAALAFDALIDSPGFMRMSADEQHQALLPLIDPARLRK